MARLGEHWRVATKLPQLDCCDPSLKATAPFCGQKASACLQDLDALQRQVGEIGGHIAPERTVCSLAFQLLIRDLRVFTAVDGLLVEEVQSRFTNPVLRALVARVVQVATMAGHAARTRRAAALAMNACPSSSSSSAPPASSWTRSATGRHRVSARFGGAGRAGPMFVPETSSDQPGRGKRAGCKQESNPCFAHESIVPQT
mmetsp:Transcript_109010/g.284225  ORF Transcript_109010/g.284225 Transcript_109010/m.284225 type:complete len:201 (+) Transcript_109010:152-754(+)